MNCLEFQRALNADPRHLHMAARNHAEECADCAWRMVKQLNLDATLIDALQMNAPDGMEDRILLATRLGDKQRMTFYAVEASVLIVISAHRCARYQITATR